MQIVVNVINSSGPFLFFNKNVQPSPAHWRQHFILRLGALAAAPPSRVVNMVNKQQESAEVRGEDDIRAHHVSVWKNKMLPPSVFLTSGTHDIVSVYSQ